MYKAYTDALKEMEVFGQITKKMKDRGMVVVKGCCDSQKANLAFALSENAGNTLIICENDLKARQMCEDYGFYCRETYYYPAKDLLFYSADIRGNAIVEERITAINALSKGGAAVVMPASALMDKIISRSEFEEDRIVIEPGNEIDPEDIAAKLAKMGYERDSYGNAPGRFAIRGDIIDIYSVASDSPVRIELFGDEVESVRTFDPESQRSVEKIERAEIVPAKDTRTFYGSGSSGLGSVLDYFDPDDTVVIIDEPNRLVDAVNFAFDEFSESIENRANNRLFDEEEGIPDIFGVDEIVSMLGQYRSAGVCSLDAAAGNWKINDRLSLETREIGTYNNSFELLVKDLKKYKKEKYRGILVCPSGTRARRMASELADEGIISFYSEDTDCEIRPGQVLVQKGNLARGFSYPLGRFFIITEADVFGSRKKKKAKKHDYSGKKISSFSQLSEGDYVVHESYGLGIYRGIKKIEVDNVLKDYAKIEYNGSNIYILATQLDMLQKYASADIDRKPRLNRIGGAEWKNTKARVKKAVQDIARDLITLYAQRQTYKGFRFGEDTMWQREFEELFPYEETEDQLRAIEDTKRDMESDRIMDRLICGDVGYGKTEVAMRAAFKAVQENKQVAFLVPTTILAQQHYNTFTERLKDFPVRVDLMCRFRTPGMMKKTVKDLEKGMVDIVIGTHRLLSDDVKFKDLGLLIIDEEQRFGVVHKEKIKKLKNKVDVLTLTATPIPRTLHMSLVGIRDMSVLEEPPGDRHPIQTYVCEYNDEIVREAICRELARNGQVYYIYNRVESIGEVAGAIRRLVPEANVAFADGQMNKNDLERVMVDFINREIDVLVATTIVETGVDIPNVNTIIIRDADRLGLSQLYQLRGRVGRSNRNAYAFLMYRRGKMLKETAEKRLLAIREFTELGSGFRIALRDLEIRGAGNILGARQHGHMDAVGYDLYCKMLSNEVARLKGEEVTEDFETVVDVPLDAFIPADYIEDQFQKLDAYKRIAAIENDEDMEDMTDELTDRFGEMPSCVRNLLLIANLKACAHRASIREIKKKNGNIELAVIDEPSFDPAGLPGLISRYKGEFVFRIYKTGNVFIYSPKGKTEETVTALKRFCEDLAAL